jgi:hypothetical protein
MGPVLRADGIREEWLPLFDAYQVDLVLCGHDHDYERSFPVRGYDSMVGHQVSTGAPVQTRRPHPVTTTAADRFDTSTGTVHLILGGETSITVTYYHAVGADPANPNTGTAGATAARPRPPGRLVTLGEPGPPMAGPGGPARPPASDRVEPGKAGAPLGADQRA